MASSGFYTFDTTTGLITPDTQNLLTTVQGEYQSAFGANLILSSNTPQGVLINGETLARTRVLQLNATTGNQINPNYSGGVFLDSILALTGSQRTAASNTIVAVTLTGVTGTIIPAGSLVQDNLGNMYSTQAQVTLASGMATVNVAAVATGPLTVAIGAITIIISTVLGWETVYNPSVQSSVGQVTQSDYAARVFRQNTLALQGQSLSEAITSGIYAIPGVNSLFYQQNDTSSATVINSVPMVANSLYACVSGGDLISIANVLNYKKSGGCNYNNSLLLTSNAVLVGPSSQTGTIVGPSSQTGTIAGPFTISGGLTNTSPTVTVTSTTGVFAGQTISATGIPNGTTVLSFVANTSITMSANATLTNASAIISLGGSPTISGLTSTSGLIAGMTVAGSGISSGSFITTIVDSTHITISTTALLSTTETINFSDLYITGLSSTANLQPGMTITGTGIPPSTTIVTIVNSASVSMSNAATLSETETISFGGSATITGISSTTGLFVGGAIAGTFVPSGTVIASIPSGGTTVIMSNPATGSGTESLTFYGGMPQDIPITDPYSGQTVNVLFDTPALIPIAVQVTASANSNLQNIVSVIQQAVVDYANGLIPNDPGLTVGKEVSTFAIAGAISITAPGIFVSSVGISTYPVVSYQSTPITIYPFQQATINTSNVTVVLT